MPTELATTQDRAVPLWYLVTAILAGLGLAGKGLLLARVGHLPHAVAFAVAILTPLLPLLWRPVWRSRRLLGGVVVVLLLAIFLMVLRTGVLHKLGRGSDQGDCVVVAAQRLSQGLWPYVVSLMPTKNAMSCGPGWVALQTPAIRLGGYFFDQILLWAFAILMFFRHLSVARVAGTLTLIGLSAGTWLSAADGNDFLPFGLLLAATYVILRDHRNTRLRPLALLEVGLLLICLAQFRVPTIFLPLLFIPWLGLFAAVTIFLAAVVSELAFLLWNAPAFVTEGPMHVGLKLFRTSLGQGRLLPSLEFLVPVALGGVCVVLLARRFHNVAAMLLAYLALIVGLPAIQNFLLQFQHHGTVLRALEYWEGGNWLMGLVPLAAVQLALQIGDRPPQTASTSPALESLNA